tara:strand:- start:2221 stop:2517 length:297 start_codon:yes stop_codon:yes gene_type:complete
MQPSRRRKITLLFFFLKKKKGVEKRANLDDAFPFETERVQQQQKSKRCSDWTRPISSVCVTTSCIGGIARGLGCILRQARKTVVERRTGRRNQIQMHW